MRRGAGLLLPTEQQEERRRQAEALRAEITRLEAEAAGPQLGSQPRRGTIQRGLVGAAAQQAGVDRAARLTELRQQYQELTEEIARGEREAAERQRQEGETAAARAAETRRQRAARDTDELRKQLDARFKVTQEFDDRVRRLREAEGAGAIDAAERQRLETLAIADRDAALRRLEGTTGRVAGANRDGAEAERARRDAEREANEILRERERLIERNETAYEAYQRRLEALSGLVERAERIGQPLPDDTIRREAADALADLEAAEKRVQDSARQTTDVARELGLTFASAFEDAIVNGKSLGDILKGLERDLLRIGTRTLVTEPLAAAAKGLLGDLFGTGGAGEGGSAAGGLLGRLFASIFHEGGVVGAGGSLARPVPAALFAGAPRFHAGGWVGLRPDEVPAILQRGERVIPRGEAQRTIGGTTVVLNITTPDASSFRASQGAILADLNRALRRSQRSV